jgi:hypothetical protein
MNPTRNIVSPSAALGTAPGVADDHCVGQQRPEKLLFYTDFADGAKLPWHCAKTATLRRDFAAAEYANEQGILKLDLNHWPPPPPVFLQRYHSMGVVLMCYATM